MLPILQVGPLAIQTPMLLLLLGLWASFSLGTRFIRIFCLDSKKIEDSILLSILAGLIGGRVFFFVRYPSAFIQNPTGILSLNPEMFDLITGLLVGTLVFLILIQRQQLDLWSVLDGLTLPVSIFSIFLSFSHLASGIGYGIPAKLPWAIDFLGQLRHPTQIYEIVLSSVILYIMLKKVKNREINFKQNSGIFFLEFVSFSALMWLFVDTFRSDTILIFANIHLVQLIAIGFLVCSFWFINRRMISQPE